MIKFICEFQMSGVLVQKEVWAKSTAEAKEKCFIMYRVVPYSVERAMS